MSDISNHQRVNDILLGPLERPALKWLAAHMPPWVMPDTLTTIGVVGAVITFLGYVLSNFDRNFLWLASLGFVINWFDWDASHGTSSGRPHWNIEVLIRGVRRLMKLQRCEMALVGCPHACYSRGR
jgi:hypothetical protein